MDSTVTPEPAPSSLISVLGDQCVACGAALASDQRYCLTCGERRGAPRLPIMAGRPATAAVPAAPPRRSRRPSASATTTLIAGIGTLLLAMGVGVLIGRSGHDAPKVSSAAPAITVVNPGAVAASGAPASTATTPTGAASGTSTSAAKAKAKATSDSSGSASNGSTALDKAAAKNNVKLPPKAVKVGSSGSGAGYKNGKFTGDFFGN